MVLGVVGLCRRRPERAYFAPKGCESWGCNRVASVGVCFSDGRGSSEAL